MYTPPCSPASRRRRQTARPAAAYLYTTKGPASYQSWRRPRRERRHPPAKHPHIYTAHPHTPAARPTVICRTLHASSHCIPHKQCKLFTQPLFLHTHTTTHSVFYLLVPLPHVATRFPLSFSLAFISLFPAFASCCLLCLGSVAAVSTSVEDSLLRACYLLGLIFWCPAPLSSFCGVYIHLFFSFSVALHFYFVDKDEVEGLPTPPPRSCK